MPKTEQWFDNESFQDHLVSLLCHDATTLRRCAPLLTAKDFKPTTGTPDGYARWIIVERALEYWAKYQEPVGRLLQPVILEYADEAGLGEKQLRALSQYQERMKGIKLVGAQAINDKVVNYKRQRMKAAAISELIDLQSGGKLSDEKWLEISQRAIKAFDTDEHITDYLEGMEERIARRGKRSTQFPFLLIDPLDTLLRRYIGPGQLGLWLGPWKRGKSMALIWTALAYLLQHLNVLYLTLEDSGKEVEDRMDSATTGVSFNSLATEAHVLQKRFKRYRMFVRTKLKIVDGRMGGWTVPRMDQLIARERDRGFYPDALIVDYDAKIVPSKSYKERRFEFDATYMELLALGTKYNMIVWTAAQTQRDTRKKKVLSGDELAEAINKIQNVTMAISLGKGDWGEDSIYLWVAAHRFDRMEMGVNIMVDKDHALIYDRIATLRKIQEEEAMGTVTP